MHSQVRIYYRILLVHCIYALVQRCHRIFYPLTVYLWIFIGCPVFHPCMYVANLAPKGGNTATSKVILLSQTMPVSLMCVEYGSSFFIVISYIMSSLMKESCAVLVELVYQGTNKGGFTVSTRHQQL